MTRNVGISTGKWKLEIGDLVRSDKWVSKTKVDDRVSSVARRAIADRLDVVVKFLKLAAKRPDEDIEYIHQLRVATRRASAAFKLFLPLLPGRRAKWFRQQLWGLRRAATDARDLDVLTLGIQDRKWYLSESSRSETLELIRCFRAEAQIPVTDGYQFLKKKFRQKAKELDARIGWRRGQCEPTYRQFATAAILPVWDEFSRAGQADLMDFHNLHQLRLAAKKLRYAMELVARAFRKKFRSETYKPVTEVQSNLGLINDHVTAIDRIDRWLSGAHAMNNGLHDIREHQAYAAEVAADRFRQWWDCNRLERVQASWRTLVSQQK